MTIAAEGFAPDPTAADRAIDFAVVFNARDLGGLATDDGRTVRRGILYRADGVNRLAGDDLEKARALRLSTVVDLRTDGEIERGGRFPVDEHPVEWHHLPMLTRMWSEDDLVVTTGAADFLRDRYVDMLTDGAASLGVIARLVGDGTPLLFHCAAGKDRTGVVAAYLLGLAGVARSEIVADYHATAGAMASFVEWLRVTYPDAIDAMTSQPPEYLEAPAEAMAGFLDVIDGRWGSMAGYASSIGIDASTVGRVRSVLVP